MTRRVTRIEGASGGREPGSIAVLHLQGAGLQPGPAGEALAADCRFSVTQVSTLAEALPALDSQEPDIVLIDLESFDANGNEAVGEIRRAAPRRPIVVLTSSDAEQAALQAIERGADDVLTNRASELGDLARRLLLAVERHHRYDSIAELAYVDPLTGLFNRRGFLHHGRQHLELTRRNASPLVVLFLDVDGMKEINDAHGHHVGDEALLDVADVLNTTFRGSDLLARIGGDEFAIILRSPPDPSTSDATERLLAAFAAFRDATPRRYRLQVTCGAAAAFADQELSLTDLLQQADTAMYESKNGARRG